MKYISKSKVVTFDNRTWWIYSKYGYETKMLKQILGQLFYMENQYNKVHVIRFDLHQPTYTTNNERVTTFNRRLFKWIRRTYRLKTIGFVWVREQEKVKNQHYHCAIFLSGHKVQHPKRILAQIQLHWQSMSGHSYTPKNCYYNVTKSNHEALQAVIYRLSYLAKARGKDKQPAQVKNYSTSRHRGLSKTL